MDKNFIIAYELTSDTTTKSINEENIPLKFDNIIKAITELEKNFCKGSVFQLMIIGKQKTVKYKIKGGKDNG